MKVIVFCTALLLGGAVSYAQADWEHVGPAGGQTAHILQSRTDSDLLYGFAGISTSYDIVKSTDGGDSWSPTGGQIGEYLYSTAMGSDGRLYAGGQGVIYMSTDEGQNWTAAPVTGFYPYGGIAAHPTNPNLAYSAGFEVSGSSYWIAFAKTTNGGASWTCQRVTQSVQGYGRCIAVSESSPGIIYVGGQVQSPSSPLLYRSTDGGTSWTEVTYSGWSSGGSMYSVAIHPSVPSTVLAGTATGIFRTTNSGATWTQTSSTTAYHYAMQYSRDDPGVVVSGGKTYFVRSLDGGLTWTTHTQGLGGSAVMYLAADWSNSDRVYTAGYTGFLRTDDTGTSWYPCNGGLYMGTVLCLHRSDASPYPLYASMNTIGLWRSTDDGASWDLITTPLDCGSLCSVVTQSGNPNRVLVLEGVG